MKNFKTIELPDLDLTKYDREKDFATLAAHCDLLYKYENGIEKLKGKLIDTRQRTEPNPSKFETFSQFESAWYNWQIYCDLKGITEGNSPYNICADAECIWNDFYWPGWDMREPRYPD